MVVVAVVLVERVAKVLLAEVVETSSLSGSDLDVPVLMQTLPCCVTTTLTTHSAASSSTQNFSTNRFGKRRKISSLSKCVQRQVGILT